MTRETLITEEDQKFMDLRDQVFKVIQPHVDKRRWKRFKQYMDVYWEVEKSSNKVIG